MGESAQYKWLFNTDYTLILFIASITKSKYNLVFPNRSWTLYELLNLTKTCCDVSQ